MAELSQAMLEQEVGDYTERMRLVNDVLDDGMEYSAGPDAPWYFGVLTVRRTTHDDVLSVEDPDGGTHLIEVPDKPEPRKSAEVEAALRETWADWLDAL